MTDGIDVLLVMVDEPTSRTIADRLSSDGDAEALVAQRRGLDGSAAEWIVGAVLGTGGIKPFLGFLLEYLKVHRVKSIKVGDVEIVNPRPEDVDRLLAGVGQRDDA